MFRSRGTTWLLVFIGLIFVAVITGADVNYEDLYPDDPEECKDEYDYIEAEGKVLG